MLRLFFYSAVVALGSVLSLYSHNAVAAPSFPPYSFSSSGTINVDVARIEFTENYHSSYAPPYVEHKFPVKPAAGVVGLINDRFRPVGGGGTLHVYIEDASVTEEKLAQTPGVKGVFTNDQSDRYSGSIKVVIAIEDPITRMPKATFTTFAKRTDTTSEYISYNDRQKFFYDFTYKMLSQLNDEISNNIQNDFQAYIQ